MKETPIYIYIYLMYNKKNKCLKNRNIKANGGQDKNKF